MLFSAANQVLLCSQAFDWGLNSVVPLTESPLSDDLYRLRVARVRAEADSGSA